MIKRLLDEVGKILAPYPVYAVGGCVRDYVIGIPPKDYDFTTPANPDQIEACVRKAGRKPFLVGKKFGTIGFKIILDKSTPLQVEVTTFRKEVYSNSRKPEVEFVTEITEDLSRRDFTINAMAMRLDGERLRIIDPFHGQEDLKYRWIKCVGNSKTRFKEDPLRILRAIRFASRFNFQYEEKTADRMKKMADTLLKISKERWMLELDSILMSKNPGRGIRDCFDFDIFKWTIPELSLQKGYNQNSQYHSFTLDEHTINVIVATPEDLNLRWAALLHDIAKPFVRTDKFVGKFLPQTLKSNYIGHEILGAEMIKRIGLHLNWSSERLEKVSELVSNHLNDDCPLRKYDNEGKNK